MSRILILLIGIVMSKNLFAQSTKDKPKLVVGIVVDQMRNDYLMRYADLYSKDGFKRLMDKGFYGANHRFSYMPTTTAPGHASVYTGTTPAIHGIAGNNWYDPIKKEGMYCVQDKSVKSVGSENAAGQMSPRNLKTTTVTDELELFWNKKSKVIGVSLKDRGAVLPAGHIPDGAYWYKDKKFITSSFYLDELPEWVQEFNEKNLVDKYIEKGWEPLFDIGVYGASLPDSNVYEATFAGEDYSTLPKDFKVLSLENNPNSLVKNSPWGNSLVLAFGKEAILKEEMGKDDITDFLAMSFSSPDYMGHAYGPRALEVQDMYLKLDLELAEFLKFLDKEVGKGNYTVMLTADHGAADVAQFSIDNQLPGGYFDKKRTKMLLEEVLLDYDTLGNAIIETLEGFHIFFNHELLKQSNIDSEHLSRYVARELTKFPGIYAAYSTYDARMSGATEFPLANLQRGIHPERSGDIVFVLHSGWMRYGKVGTTHGTPWVYDQNVPLLLYGHGIKKGKTYRETNIRDIAPTLSIIMGVPFPSGTTGSPVVEAIDD
ncbi:MAG: alkaline phosphatase PafA [Bacteroidota bacterium]